MIFRIKLYLHGIGVNGAASPITVGDSLAADPGARFDMVLTNPPFGKKSRRPWGRAGTGWIAGAVRRTMRVISWNVQGRMKALPEQLKALVERQPDLVALQEVRESTVAQWRDGFQMHGLAFIMESVTFAQEQGRKYGLLIASRWPITQLPWMDLPYQERVLSVQVASPWGTIELHNAHIPNSDKYGWIKVETFEAIYEKLACVSAAPRILCGDFNSPQWERADGYLVTLGQDLLSDGRAVIWETWKDKAGRSDTGMRWDRAERLVLTGLASYELVDVYRACNGYAVQGCSWWWTGQDKAVGRRFDHIFAARALNVAMCDYLPEFHTNGLSDHAPIEARFDPGRASGSR